VWDWTALGNSMSAIQPRALWSLSGRFDRSQAIAYSVAMPRADRSQLSPRQTPRRGSSDKSISVGQLELHTISDRES
jgi:hypothetical protein